MQNEKPGWVWILIVIASLCAVFVGLAHPSEYGFYTLTRWLVTAAAVTNAVLLIERNQSLAVMSCILALVFNPIIPFRLGREVWILLDFVVPVLLIWGGIKLMEESSNEAECSKS